MKRAKKNPHAHFNIKAKPITAPKSNFIILACGGSNIQMWATERGGNIGQTQCLATLSKYNTGEQTIINAGMSGSYLTRSALLCAEYRKDTPNLDAMNCWVDDSSKIFTAGKCLTDALAKLTTSGISSEDITEILWSQGEADATELFISQARRAHPEHLIHAQDYWHGLVWLKDFFFATFPNLRKIHIRPLARRTHSDNQSFGVIRDMQQRLAQEFPTQVIFGSATYDLECEDGVHRTAKGFAVEGVRVAYELLATQELWTGNTTGARISGVHYNEKKNDIIVKIEHDKGKTLRNASGIIYTGKAPVDCTPKNGLGMFAVHDAQGKSLPIRSVKIIAQDKIAIKLQQTIVPKGATLQYGFNNMFGVDLGSIIYDNHSTNPLPLQTATALEITDAGSLQGITAMEGLVSLLTSDSEYAVESAEENGVVWKKMAGSGSAAKRDGDKPTPQFFEDISLAIKGASAVSGWVFNGEASQKLLVEHSLTQEDDFTLCVSFTCDSTAYDNAKNNAIIATSAAPGTGQHPVFFIRQMHNDLSTTQCYCGKNGTTLQRAENTNLPQLAIIRRDASQFTLWNRNAHNGTKEVIEPTAMDKKEDKAVFAIGNIPFHGSGASDTDTTFRGAVHHVILFKRALSDQDCEALRSIL